MLDELSTTAIILLSIKSVVSLIIIGAVLYYAGVIIRNNHRVDKPNLKYLRIASQILAASPFLLLIWMLALAALQFFSADFAAGCNSGPAIGVCFAMMVMTMLLAPATLLFFTVSLITYRLSTVKK